MPPVSSAIWLQNYWQHCRGGRHTKSDVGRRFFVKKGVIIAVLVSDSEFSIREIADAEVLTNVVQLSHRVRLRLGERTKHADSGWMTPWMVPGNHPQRRRTSRLSTSRLFLIISESPWQSYTRTKMACHRHLIRPSMTKTIRTVSKSSSLTRRCGRCTSSAPPPKVCITSNHYSFIQL